MNSVEFRSFRVGFSVSTETGGIGKEDMGRLRGTYGKIVQGVKVKVKNFRTDQGAKMFFSVVCDISEKNMV